jgi:hypothetical protein
VKQLLVLAMFVTSCGIEATPIPVGYFKKKADPALDTLINGSEVTEARPEIVRLLIGGAACTGTLVGPRAVLTAAHCIDDGETAKFTVAGKPYTGTGVQSARYPEQDHDISLVILPAPGVVIDEYASIGGKASRGADITLFGYGCTQEGGGGGNDGKLRSGMSRIIGYSGYDMVSRKEGGSALCFGDSGGPAFMGDKLIGVNSKGNIRDTNYNTRLDLKVSRDWIKMAAENAGVQVCGVTKSCTTKGDPDPSCQTIYHESLEKMKTLKECLK